MSIDFGTLTLRRKPEAQRTSGQSNEEYRPMADPKTENKEIVNDKARAAAQAEPLKVKGENEVDLQKNREDVERALDDRSKANEAGHEKNMEAIEKAHTNNDGQPDPKLGREDNSNTPIIDPVTGKKHWPQQRVAGVPHTPKK